MESNKATLISIANFTANPHPPIETDKQNHIGGCHAATISESIRQRKGKYEYHQKTTCS